MLEIPSKARGVIAIILGLFAGATWIMADPPSGATASFGKKRLWSDKSAKFKVDAKLIDATSKTIKLEKDDGKVITIPLEKMSEPDQAFVEAFLAANEAMSGQSKDDDNPFKGGVDKDDATEDSSKPTNPTKSSASIPKANFNATRAKPFSITYGAPYWKGSELAPIKTTSSEDRILQLPMSKKFFDTASVMVAGEKPTAIVGVYNPERGGSTKFGRFGSLSLESGKPKAIGEFPEAWKLLSMSPSGKRFIAVSVSQWDVGNDLAVFEQNVSGTYEPKILFTAG